MDVFSVKQETKIYAEYQMTILLIVCFCQALAYKQNIPTNRLSVNNPLVCTSIKLVSYTWI